MPDPRPAPSASRGEARAAVNNAPPSSKSARPEKPPDRPDDDDDDYLEYFYDEPGSAPGTLRIDRAAPDPKIYLIDYTAHQAVRRVLTHPEECIPYLKADSVTWIDVQGLGDEALLRRLGDIFNLHPLTLEDVVNVPQRPKVEFDNDLTAIVARMVSPHLDGNGYISEQVSLIIGKHHLLTIQEEQENDAFAPVRDRIRTNRGEIRQHGTDYLAVALLDAIVDGYFPVLEDYGDRIEALEDKVLFDPSRRILEEIYDLKRELLGLRFAIHPQVAALKTLRGSKGALSKEVRLQLRDCYDHASQVLDAIEIYRELAIDLMNLYMSAAGNRMNEVMKVLTVISSIFIPLTFIAGVYGMNFDPEKSPLNMPELEWYWGYPATLGLMGAIAAGLIFFFWRRGWFKNLL